MGTHADSEAMLRDLDTLLKMVAGALTEAQAAAAENKALRSDAARLARSAELQQLQLAGKNAQIEGLLAAEAARATSQSAQAEAAREESGALDATIKLKYDLEVAHSSRRAMERELAMLRNENQRLSRANILSGIEVSALHSRVRELEGERRGGGAQGAPNVAGGAKRQRAAGQSRG